MFDALRNYRSIAWDFDDTLVGHKKSPLFWHFIRDNPFDQTHHIITMRTHGWQHTMFEEMEALNAPIARTHFEHILNAPDHYFDQYQRAKAHGLALSEDHPYFTFKGEECKRIGADVLVDDMESKAVSARGCQIHGIPHLHPDDL